MDTTVPQRLRDLVEAGHLGKKSGEGFYQYSKGKVVKSKTPQSHQGGYEVIDRMILRMLNEVVACLRERVVDEADLLDGGMVYGTGFAPFRGGPLHYIETVGADVLYKRLQELEQKYGPRFQPDPGWEQVSGFASTNNRNG
jgi:3-hydroxyacyl-CoA dehydrogenase/enoyl-CoA hydratase/3-hydroxybutyryl-CoA epimerase